MTRNDITRLAREAGFVGFDGENKTLFRFAALVSAAEREKCAEICDQEEKRAEEWSTGLEAMSADRCAVAIRKRGTDAP